MVLFAAQWNSLGARFSPTSLQFRRRCSPHRQVSETAGIVKKNVLPAPGADSTPMRPRQRPGKPALQQFVSGLPLGLVPGPAIDLFGPMVPGCDRA